MWVRMYVKPTVGRLVAWVIILRIGGDCACGLCHCMTQSGNGRV
jgi:hypothetical protein